jgi:uncharacterized iron-regulated membrane protein
MDMPAATAAPRAVHRRRRMRATLSWLHLWAGLTVGTAFALVALAGTVLVFQNELLRLQHPTLTQHAPVADGRVLGALIQRWSPQGLNSLNLPSDALPVWEGYFKGGRRAYFAPEDGALLLTRSQDDDAVLWLRAWHTKLLGGETGENVLGIVGSIALCMLLSGLYLWWPRHGRVRAHLKMHSGPPVRRWLTWHRTVGVMLLPLLLLATFTGVSMVYSRAFQSALIAVFGGEAVKPPRTPRGDTHIDWAAVLDRASTAMPGARLSRLSAPKPGDGTIAFRARADGEWHPVGRSLVLIHADDSRLLKTYDATRNGLGARMSDTLYPLHTGAVGGTLTKCLTAFTGLLPAFMLITGFLFWRRRRGHH